MEKEGILIPFSAETKQGRDEIWALIESLMGAAPELQGDVQEEAEVQE